MAALAADSSRSARPAASPSISCRARCPWSTSHLAGTRSRQATAGPKSDRGLPGRSDSPRDRSASGTSFEGSPALDVGDYQADPARPRSRLLFEQRQGPVQATSRSTRTKAVLRDGSAGMQRLWLDGDAARHLRVDGRAAHLDDTGRQAGGRGSSRSRRAAVKTAKMQVAGVARFHARQPRCRRAHPRQDPQCRAKIRQRRRRTEEQELAEASKMWGDLSRRSDSPALRRPMVDRATDGALAAADRRGTWPQPIAKVRKRIVDGATDNIRVLLQRDAEAATGVNGSASMTAVRHSDTAFRS